MSGICGILHESGRAVSESALVAMGRALAHRGPDGAGSWTGGPAGLACRLHRLAPETDADAQPLVAADAVMVFAGRLDNRAELLAALRHRPPLTPTCPDPELALAAWRALGERFVERLDGDFALAVFERARRRLLLARDAIGVRPLYWCRAGEAVLFASEIKALLAHPEIEARPDDDGLAGVLLDRAQRSVERTCFRGIRSLPPAHLLVADGVRLQVRPYWDFDLSGGLGGAGLAEHAEAFRHLFRQAVRRRLRSTTPVAVSVSGGLDSSSILGVALECRRADPVVPEVSGYSYVSPHGTPSDEQRFLGDIEMAHGVAIRRLPACFEGPLAGAAEALWHIEVPFLDGVWSTTRRFLQTIAADGARTVLSGHWADELLCSQAYLVDLFRRGRWRTIRRHMSSFRDWYGDIDPSFYERRFAMDLVKYLAPGPLLSWARRLRRPRLAPWYSAAFRDRSRGAAATLPRRGPAHGRALYEQVRSPRHVLCLEWNDKVGAMHGLQPAFPFLDRDLLVFLMSSPGAMLSHDGVPKALLRRGLGDLLPAAIAERRWKADLTHVANAGMRNDLAAVRRLLHGRPMAVELGYVDGDALRARLQDVDGRIDGPTCALAGSLADLIGLEVWLRVFFGDGRRVGLPAARGGGTRARGERA